MSDFIVLGNAQVHEVLINLSRHDIVAFKDAIGNSLVQFSTGTEKTFQPEPGVVVRPDGQKVLFRPFTSPTSVGTKIIVEPASRFAATNLQPPEGQATAPSPVRGILAVCDQEGRGVGVINAEEVTGYRTALSAIIPYLERRKTDNIVVFGAGMQALWHMRLALALRGGDIKRITVVNRSASRADNSVKQLKQENETHWQSSVEIDYLASTQDTYESQLARHIADADVIFCTVPSDEPLFPCSYIKLQEAGSKGPYISAIGSWQSNMMELDPNLLRNAAEASRSYQLPGYLDGAIIVDDPNYALLHAGEVIRSKLQKGQIMALGEILAAQQQENNYPTATWLGEGFVIYKSVGVSVTDLAAGNAILSLASKHNLGTKVTSF